MWEDENVEDDAINGCFSERDIRWAYEGSIVGPTDGTASSVAAAGSDLLHA